MKKLVQLGLFDEIVSGIRKTGPPSHKINAVDIYFTREYSVKHDIKIDSSKPCNKNISMFFGSRHFEVCRVDSEDVMPYDSIEQVKYLYKNAKLNYKNVDETVIRAENWDYIMLVSRLSLLEIKELGEIVDSD